MNDNSNRIKKILNKLRSLDLPIPRELLADLPGIKLPGIAGEEFKFLKKRKTGKKKKKRYSQITPELSRDLRETRISLAELAAACKEELAVFRMKFTQKLPSDRIFSETFQDRLQKLIDSYDLLIEELEQPDITRLEKLFSQVKQDRRQLEYVKILHRKYTEKDEHLARIKSAALGYFNREGNWEELAESIQQARQYIKQMSMVNSREFKKIPKEDELIRIFNRIEKAFGDYLRALRQLEKLSPGKGETLKSGLIKIKRAHNDIQALLNGTFEFED